MVRLTSKVREPHIAVIFKERPCEGISQGLHR
jgi:hypothetical protein